MNESLPLGFGLDDDSWLRQAREALEPTSWDNLGDYEILAEVSRGGQGVVLRARDAQGRLVALKRLIAGTLTGTRGRLRFEREMEITARLDHPGVVPLLRREILDRQPLLVMPWIEGVQPDRWARPEGEPPQSRRQILQLFDAICDAIAHAHRRGVIHRDLKPSNILVDAHGQPHVLDFGIGKLLQEDYGPQEALTRTTEFVGSPTYAPPERLLQPGSPADVRDDVYSLGVLLYGLLADAEPYPFGDTLASAIRALTESDPTPIRRHAPDLERDLAVVVHKAIAKEPEMRYPSVEAFQDDLQRFRDGAPVAAHPPSLSYRVQKFVRRNPAVTTLGAVSLAMLIGFGSHAKWQAKQLTVERNDAIHARSLADEETRRTHDALGFLVDEVLPQLDPRVRGRVAATTEVLEDASVDLAERFVGAPDLEIEVRQAMARLFLQHGDYAAAERHLARASFLLPAAVAADKEPSADRRRDLHLLLAEAHLQQARLEDVEVDLQKAEALFTPALTADDVAPLSQMDGARRTRLRIQLAMAQRAFEPAERLCRAYLQALFALEPSTRPQAEIWRAQLMLTSLLRRDGRTAESVAMAQELVLDALKRYPDGAHLEVADARRAWGWSMFHHGSLREAEEPLRQALATRKQLLGVAHPEIAQSLVDVAIWSQFFGRDVEEIRGMYQEAVAILRQAGAGEHQLMAGAWTGLASLATQEGDFETAENLYTEILAVLRKRFGGEHPALSSLHMDRGMMLTEQERFEDARTAFQEAERLLERGEGAHVDHPSLWMARARNEERAQQSQAAISLYRQAADALAKRHPNGCMPMVVCLKRIGNLEEARGQATAAADVRAEAADWEERMAAARQGL
ncbi:MAG: protein kinase domain-containing protein [Planctomycetota bacterium]